MPATGGRRVRPLVFAKQVRRHFRFLTGLDIDGPRIHIHPPRECSIVYGNARLWLEILHDWGSAPLLRFTHRDAGSGGHLPTVAFAEILALHAPDALAGEPSWNHAADDAPWLAWAARQVHSHARRLLPPSEQDVARICAERDQPAPSPDRSRAAKRPP